MRAHAPTPPTSPATLARRWAATVAILAALVVGVALHPSTAVAPAAAQSVAGLPGAFPNTGSGVSDPYSGRLETVQTFSGAMSSTAVATVVTFSTGQRVSLKALTLTLTTAADLVLVDSATGLALAHFYCPANVPQPIPDSQLGVGITTALGSSVGAYVSTGTPTLYWTARVQRPTQ